MGKGDKRSKKGKIFKGSFGNSRLHKVKKKKIPVPAKAPAKKPVVEVPVSEVVEAPKKKAAPRKKKAEEGHAAAKGNQ